MIGWGGRRKDSREGKTVLGLCSRPYKYFTYKALRRLGYEHRHGVGNIFGLQQLGGVFARMGAELGVDRARADGADANSVLAQIFSHGSGQTHQAPLRSAIHSAVPEGVLPGQ